jgi:hypothetical protein
MGPPLACVSMQLGRCQRKRRNPVGTEADWLGGGPMFWSSFHVGTNVKLMRQAGLEIQDASVVDQSQLGNPVQFLWVIARRPLRTNNGG